MIYYAYKAFDCSFSFPHPEFGIWQVTADKYDELIATPNRNKADPDVIEARSVGEALSALKVADDQEEDRHPER